MVYAARASQYPQKGCGSASRSRRREEYEPFAC